MTVVTVQFKGIARIGARLSRVSNFLGRTGIRTLLQDAGQQAVADFRGNIDSFTPGTVSDLKLATKIMKQRQVGFVYPILVRTRQMYDSMRTRVLAPSGSKGWVMRLDFSGTRRGGGSNADIAEAHIEGRGRLPRRDFLKVGAEWRRNLLNGVRDALRNRNR